LFGAFFILANIISSGGNEKRNYSQLS